jgi:hypothetical protein
MGIEFDRLRDSSIDTFFALPDGPIVDDEGLVGYGNCFEAVHLTLSNTDTATKLKVLAEIIEEGLDSGADLSDIDGRSVSDLADDILNSVVAHHMSYFPEVMLKEEERSTIFNT